MTHTTRVSAALYRIESGMALLDDDAEICARAYRLLEATNIDLIDAAEHAIKELGQIVGLIPLVGALYLAKE